MGVIQSGATVDLSTVDPTSKALRVSQRPIEGEQYRLAATSGLLTAVAAGTATAGYLFAFRWGSATEACLLHRVIAKWRTIAGFTAAQEINLDIIRATGFSASTTGGTAATLTGNNTLKRTSQNVTQLTDARIGTTTALTAGTQTLDTMSMAFDGASEMATGAAIPRTSFEVEADFTVVRGGPLVLLQNEGFIVRNLILMGAGGTARVSVEVDWSEVGTGTNW